MIFFWARFPDFFSGICIRLKEFVRTFSLLSLLTTKKVPFWVGTYREEGGWKNRQRLPQGRKGKKEVYLCSKGSVAAVGPPQSILHHAHVPTLRLGPPFGLEREIVPAGRVRAKQLELFPPFIRPDILLVLPRLSRPSEGRLLLLGRC